MMVEKSLRKVLSNSVLFSIGGVAGKIISVLMLPIYTNYLSDTEYGIAVTVTSFVSIMSLIVMLSLRSAIMRFYNEISNKVNKARFLGSIFSVIIVNSILVITFLIITRNTLVKVLFPSIPFFPIVLMGILTLLFDVIYFAYQGVLQAQQNGKEYALNSVIYLLMHASLNILFIVVLKMGADGMVLGLLTANFLMAVYGIIRMLVLKVVIPAFDIATIKSSLKYSLPIIPHELSNNASAYFTKVIMNTNISYAATGIFSIASQVSTIMGLVQSSLNLAFHPWFNEQMKKGVEGRRLIKRFSIFTFTVYGYFCIVVAFFCKEALYLLTNTNYHSAWRVVPILVFGLTVRFIYYCHVLAILYNLKASKFICVCSLSGCIANVIFLYFLIPKFSLYGAALANFLSIVVLSLVTVLYSRKVEYVDFGLSKMILESIVVACIMTIGLIFDYLGDDTSIDLMHILYKSGIILAITGLIVLFKKDFIMEGLHKVFRKRK